MDLKSIFANLTAGFVGAAVLFGGAWGFGMFDNDVIIETDGEVTVVEGPQGPRGFNGTNGSNGTDGTSVVGPTGPQGPAGTSMSLSEITDAVVDELEDREDRIEVTFTSGSGDKTKTLVILEDGLYEFSFRKYTSGDFEVSLEDEDGDTVTLMDTTGHVNTEDTLSLEEGEYLLHISSEGSWLIEVAQL